MMATVACTPYPSDLILALKCVYANSPWFSDVNIAGLVVLLFLSWLGFRSKAPGSLMYTFGIWFLIAIYYIIDVTWFRTVIIIGIVLAGTQLAVSLMKGPKIATEV